MDQADVLMYWFFFFFFLRKSESRRPTRDVKSEPRSVNAVTSRTPVEVVDDPYRKHVVIATMNFTAVERYDDGLYECVATNEVC